MATEEINRKFTPKETNHSMKRRAPWHDYYAIGTYMLTVVVEGRRPLLGRLVINGDGKEPREVIAGNGMPAGSGQQAKNGQPPVLCDCFAEHSNAGQDQSLARIELSPLGVAIKNEALKKLSEVYPQVEVWKVCIMPDHIHLIVHVKRELPEGKHLGNVVAGFKRGCNIAARRLWNVVHFALFEPGYNDKLLFSGEQLARWKHYLDDNPRRLAMKRLYPDLFVVKRDHEIAGRKCQIVGNQFLLDIPDKMAVIVHRRYSEAEYRQLTEQWLACGERGGVLVSAAIAPKEKAVMREAMNRGYRIIWLRENGFPELYKPSGEAFDACIAGLMLQVSPWGYHMDRRVIQRNQCLFLNDLAIKIEIMSATTFFS